MLLEFDLSVQKLSCNSSCVSEREEGVAIELNMFGLGLNVCNRNMLKSMRRSTKMYLPIQK